MNEYTLIAPNWYAACYCEKVRPLPPPESFPTLREAVERVFTLVQEVAELACNNLNGDIKVVTTFLLKKEPLTVDKIIEKFKDSLAITAVVFVSDKYFTHIALLLQGKNELEQLAAAQEMQELKSSLKAMNASCTTLNGIKVN